MGEPTGVRPARRMAAGGLALACAALGIAAGVGGATPAQALDVTPTVYVEAGADGGGGFTSTLTIGIGVTGGTVGGERHLVVDASALAGQVVMTDLDTQDGCTAQELVVTCDLASSVTR